jgi:hypothetical protein
MTVSIELKTKPSSRVAAALAGVLLTLGGCQAVVEDRVESGLIEAGVPAGMATCMAGIWAKDLSVGQIREISDLAARLKAERQTLTVGRLIDHARAWNDPAALAVVASSAARCALS